MLSLSAAGLVVLPCLVTHVNVILSPNVTKTRFTITSTSKILILLHSYPSFPPFHIWSQGKGGSRPWAHRPPGDLITLQKYSELHRGECSRLKITKEEWEEEEVFMI